MWYDVSLLFVQEEVSTIKAAGRAWYKTMISDSDYTEFENFSKWLGVTQWAMLVVQGFYFNLVGNFHRILFYVFNLCYMSTGSLLRNFQGLVGEVSWPSPICLIVRSGCINSIECMAYWCYLKLFLFFFTWSLPTFFNFW